MSFQVTSCSPSEGKRRLCNNGLITSFTLGFSIDTLKLASAVSMAHLWEFSRLALDEKICFIHALSGLIAVVSTCSRSEAPSGVSS